jgi:UDP-sugar transporter A1/2/3
VIAVFSAIASIASESLTKAGSFWESQLWLYLWGVFFSIVSYPIATRMTNSADRAVNAHISVTSTVTIAIYFSFLTASVGLIVAAMLRKKDNLMKLVGTSISLLTIAATQYIIFPALRSSGFTTWKIIGGLVVIISTGCYNYFKDTSPDEANFLSQLLPTSNEYTENNATSELEKSATASALGKLFSWITSIRPTPSPVSYRLVEIQALAAEDSTLSTNKD